MLTEFENVKKVLVQRLGNSEKRKSWTMVQWKTNGPTFLRVGSF
jgi:hypothetical protein